MKTCENENECFSCEITSMDICPHYDETDLTGDVAFLTCVTKDIIPPNDKVSISIDSIKQSNLTLILISG